MELTSSQKGGLAELKVAAEAAHLGLGILRPMTEGLRYDLVLDIAGSLLRVQVKWATLKGTRRLDPPAHKPPHPGRLRPNAVQRRRDRGLRRLLPRA